MSAPQMSEIEALVSKSASLQARIGEMQIVHDEAGKYIEETSQINQRILNLGAINQIPPGVYIREYTINRKGSSEIKAEIFSTDASLQTITVLEKFFKNVKITGVQAEQEKKGNIYTISFKITN
jgi:hypothetical protein